jgi:hypothetical protein
MAISTTAVPKIRNNVPVEVMRNHYHKVRAGETTTANAVNAWSRKLYEILSIPS